MGATAFIIAEFLEVPYIDVVIAAAIPAALYYLVLFLQVDAIAARFGLLGLPKSELPRVFSVLISGWVFLIPLGVLLYFLFGLGYNPGLSAMYAATSLFVLYLLKIRRLPSRAEWANFIFGSGENLLPLMLIAGGAGVVMGVLNASGLAFQLSIILAELGQSAGIFWMLVVTALVSIILGMGMPTAAVYIVLATVIAPALIEIGLKPMAAHLFLFYFGLLSMLTPPVAVASMVAAGDRGLGHVADRRRRDAARRGRLPAALPVGVQPGAGDAGVLGRGGLCQPHRAGCGIPDRGIGDHLGRWRARQDGPRAVLLRGGDRGRRIDHLARRGIPADPAGRSGGRRHRVPRAAQRGDAGQGARALGDRRAGLGRQAFLKNPPSLKSGVVDIDVDQRPAFGPRQALLLGLDGDRVFLER